MSGNLTPTTMPEWMSNINRRMAHIERHRHGGSGGDNSVTLDNKWFRVDAARVDTAITGADGTFTKVPLATPNDPFGMLDENFTFIAPRDGAVQFSGAVSVWLSGTSPGNVYPILYDSDTGITMLRGTQFASPTPTWSGGFDQVHVLSGIVDVVEGHHYTFWAFVSSPGNVKSFHSYPENTFLSGTYIDGSSTPGDKGEPGPPGPPGSDLSLDSGWHYLGTKGEPPLLAPTTPYDTPGLNWSTGRFRRDAAGCVHMDGLLVHAVAAPPTLPLFVLPAGFRPAKRQLFAVMANGPGGAVPSNVEVLPTGAVNVTYSSATAGNFFFLSTISFMAEDALTVEWIPLTLLNGWTDYDVSGYGTAAYFIDSAGDVHFRGVIRGGSPSVVAFNLPVGAFHTDYTWMMTMACAGAPSSLARIDVGTNGVATLAGYTNTGNNDWVALSGCFISNPAAAWTGTVTLMNGWARYDNGWPPMQYVINRYGVASMRGLIKNGTVTVPTKITAGAVPQAFAPAYNRGGLVAAAGTGAFNAAARLDVRQDGSVDFTGFVLNGNNQWMWTGGRWFVNDR